MSEEAGMEELKGEMMETQRLWQEDAARWQTRLTSLESEVAGLRSDLGRVESTAQSESMVLTRRMRTADTLLGYLKSKAKIMAIPRYAQTSCGIKQQDGVGLVDKRGIPMAEWSNSAYRQLLEPTVTGKEKQLRGSGLQGERSRLIERAGEGDFVEKMALTVMQITEVMEVLLKRAIVAETEVDWERERSVANQDEILKKTVQIESMWARVEEMEKVAMGTTGVLKEMQLKLENMEEETSKQRQRATENEQELSRVRHDFVDLKSSVDSLVKARETIRYMEDRIHEVEGISERLTARVMDLESGRRQRDTEIEKLIVENDSLRAALDLKEAEAAALGEQYRMLVDEFRSSP